MHRAKAAKARTRIGSAIAVLGISSASFVACASQTATTDSCAFLSDAKACHRTVVAAIDACLADEGGDAGAASGVLSRDGRTCQYPSGRIVTFSTDARTLSGSGDLDVTVTYGRARCAHVVQRGGVLVVTPPDGNSLQVTSSTAGALVACPDQSRHLLDDAAILSRCPVARAVVPAVVTTRHALTFEGALAGSSTHLWSCVPSTL